MIEYMYFEVLVFVHLFMERVFGTVQKQYSVHLGFAQASHGPSLESNNSLSSCIQTIYSLNIHVSSIHQQLIGNSYAQLPNSDVKDIGLAVTSMTLENGHTKTQKT